jgi:hypothetical protein
MYQLAQWQPCCCMWRYYKPTYFYFSWSCETVGLFNYALWVFLLCLLCCCDVTALTIYSPANQYQGLAVSGDRAGLPIRSIWMMINTEHRSWERENMLLESYIWRQKFLFFSPKVGHAVVQLVETLRYKSEDRGFDSRWCHWNFPFT